MLPPDRCWYDNLALGSCIQEPEIWYDADGSPGGPQKSGEHVMSKAYTLATYRVVPGKEDEFVKVWNDLAATFSSLPNPPYWGTLIRSTSDPTLFHSFGPWGDADDVAAMRENSSAGAAFQAIQSLCLEMTPGDYEIVAHVKVRDEPST